MSNEVLFIGGILNYTDPILHWQLYFWLWVLLVIITIVCHVGWHQGKWLPFKPLHGLYFAHKARSYAAFIFNYKLIGELVSERDAKCIFDYGKDFEYRLETATGILAEFKDKIKHILFNYAVFYLPEISYMQGILYKFGHVNSDVEIAKKFQNYEWEAESSVTISPGVHTDIILDADRWTVPGSPQHKIIKETAMEWNEKNPDDQIHSYSKIQRYFLNGKIPVPEGIKDMVTVPWVRIDSAFPLDMNYNEMAGARRQKAHEDEEDERTAYSRYFAPLLIGSFVLAGFIMTLRFVLKIMHK